MIIPINDLYRIAADRLSWSVQENRGVNRKTGEVRWASISWHVDLQSAVKCLANMMIRMSDAQTLADALREVDRVTHTLTHAFSLDLEIKARAGSQAGKIKNLGDKGRRREKKLHNNKRGGS